MTDVIPQIAPWIDDAELEMLREVVKSTYVTEHRLTERFEEEIRRLTGAKHAVTVANGTVALYCSLLALGIKADDEVLVPDMTFIATANAVVMAGGRPVFVDVDRKTFCMDPEHAAALITPRTKGILPVHLYGIAADVPSLEALCCRHGLWLLEDAAQGVGVRLHGRHVGTFGRLGVLSFYGNKTITTGEGGVVLSNEGELARGVFRLKNHGRDRKGIFVHEHIGFNFSFTEMQAAVGLAQLGKLDRIIGRKAEIRKCYEEALGGLPGLSFPSVPHGTSPVFWFTSVLSDDVEGLASHLSARGIQTRRFFLPLHEQPCYQGRGLDLTPRPGSRWAYDHGLSLPSSYDLSKEAQERVIEAVRDFCLRKKAV